MALCSDNIGQPLSLNLSYQEQPTGREEYLYPGNISRFVNSALGYGLMLIPQSINITSSVNASYRLLKKHNFNANMVWQKRNIVGW